MKSARFFLVILTTAVGISVLYSSCSKKDQPWPGKEPGGHKWSDNAMVLYWNQQVNAVLSGPMRQPDRSRYFAIIEIAVHDALNNIKPVFEQYRLNSPSRSASPDAAVASAAFWAIKGLNLQGNHPVDQWYDSCLALLPNGGAKEAGKALGKLAAETIIANRATDGYSQVIPSSAIPADGTTPGAYRQTNAIPFRVIPNWGTVLQPFVVKTNVQFRPQGPYKIQSADYARDFNEVKEKGARTGSTRTEKESTLTMFWADNRMSVTWNEFAIRAIANKKMDAWKTARLFALLHTALADGFNTVMESKYHFYYWRPETAIREADTDENAATLSDANWLPYVIEAYQPTPPGNWVSPPVPEYPSSYSMAGGISCQLLKRIFGGDHIEVDLTSSTLPGTTLRYNSLSKAARDNSITKIYAGWYFRKAVLDGEQMGNRIADYVFSNSFRER